MTTFEIPMAVGEAARLLEKPRPLLMDVNGKVWVLQMRNLAMVSLEWRAE